MAILTGIDEAGYGPIMGPLVVTGVSLELPDEMLGADLWDVLRLSVARTRKGSSGRIIINDSKALHNKSGKTNLLQRGSLAALRCVYPDLPATVGQLLRAINCDLADQLQGHPWYRDRLDNWPLDINADEIQTASAWLKRNASEQGVSLVNFTCCPLPEGLYNKLVRQTQNKATVLFNTAARIIYRIWTQYPGKNVQIILDKQGGRSHYREHLQKMFPDLEMKILKESDNLSSYQLSSSRRYMKAHFIAKGDQNHLPVALASMVSKYVRELFMDVLNDYFHRLCPALKPTAGYYEDGMRFLEDLKTAGLLSSLPQDILVREK